MNTKTKIIIIVLALIAVGVGFFFLHPHKYTVSEHTPATCTENGSTTYKCWCGKSYTEEAPAIGHNYVEEITKEATCTENGVATFTCSVCGDSYTEDIISTGHNYVSLTDEVDAENCVSYICSICGDSYKEENHSYSYITEGNKKSYICDKCSFELFAIELYDESKDMYAQSDCDIYEGPDANDFEKVLTLKTNDAVEVIGVVNEYNGEDVYWTVVKIDDTDNEYFISGVYLSDTKVSTTTSSSSSTTSSGSSSTSSGTTSSSSTQSNTSSNSSNSSARDKLKNAQHDSGNNVQSGGSGDGVPQGPTGINWH